MDCLHKQKGPPVGENPRPTDLKYQANRYEYGLSGCKSAIYPPIRLINTLKSSICEKLSVSYLSAKIIKSHLKSSKYV